MTHDELVEAVTTMKAQMAANTQGVNNFRTFQLDATKKIGFVYGATWLAGIIALLFMAVLGWALTLIVPAARVVVDDYYHNHPNAKMQSYDGEAITASSESATIHVSERDN